MGFIRRAFLYVTRKRGKSILLFIILLVMATFVLTGLSIWKASVDTQLGLRQSLGGKLDIYVDWENSPYVIRENVKDEIDEETGKTITGYIQYSTVQFTPADIAAIKSVPGVKYCSARQEHLAPFEEFSLLPGTMGTDAKYKGHTKVLGVCDTEDDELFTTGTMALTEGRHITPNDSHVAIISRDLAEKSGLKVGDYITARSYNTEDKGFTGKEIRVRIIGLFTPNTVEQFGDIVTTYDKIQNRVFVDLQTSVEIESDGRALNYGFSAVNVTIDDPQEMERVAADIKALPDIDWKAFTVESDNKIYENATAPLDTLNELVVTLLLVIIVVSAVILALILTLWTKTRIHETGVLLAVGIKKPAIIAQYLFEVLLIAVLAFGFSYFTSSAMAGQIGNHLLEQSMQTEPEDSGSVRSAAVEVGADNLIQKPLPAEKGIEVSVGLDNLVRLYLIGLVIIIVAVSASSVTVMRLKPREILSKMS